MHTRRSFLRTSLAATTAILADVSSIVAKERPATWKSPSNAFIDGVKFVTPDAADYATAREVYNAGIVTQPKVIACCTSEIGVQHALERAKAENWPVAVKAGGHSFEGFCLNDDGLVVSVSRLAPPKCFSTPVAVYARIHRNLHLQWRFRWFPEWRGRRVPGKMDRPDRDQQVVQGPSRFFVSLSNAHTNSVQWSPRCNATGRGD